MTFSSEVLADSPVVYYRLDESSGTTADDATANNEDGTYTGTVTLGETGGNISESSTAARFGTGSSQDGYVAMPTGAWDPSGSWTVEAIARMNTTTGAQTIFQWNGSGGQVRYYKPTSTARVGAIVDTSTYAPTEQSIAVDTWYHLCLVYDDAAETLTFYQNGSEVHQYTSVAAGSYGTVSSVRVGAVSTGAAFAGLVDEFALYESALSAARVSAHHAAAFSSSQTITVPLLDLSGEVFEPASVDLGSGQTITVGLIDLSGEVFEPAVQLAAADQAITVPLIDLSGEVFEPAVGQPTSPTGAAVPAYVVRMVDMHGASPQVLPLAAPATIVRGLNVPDRCSFRFPRNAYDAADVPIIGTASGVREVQVFRDDDLLFWGPVIAASTSAADGQVDCDAVGTDWYLHRRAIDGARTNLVGNPSFESSPDLTGWTQSGSFTATISTTTKVLGSKAARLVNATAGTDAYLAQSFTVVGTAVGTLLTCVAWVYVDVFTGAAHANRGLFIQGSQGGVVQAYESAPLDEHTPTGQWVRQEITIWVPPNEGWQVEVRVYAPAGTVFWDACQVVAMESVSTAGLTGSTTAEVDVARIVNLLVQHVQSAGAGKSQVYIGSNCPPTGVSEAKHYQYADHVQFDEALREFLDRDDVADYSMVLTPTSRSFTLWPGRKGVDRSGSVTLTYGEHVAAYRFARDGAGCVTRATVLGEGDGPDREEGEYADAAQVGGVILQQIRTAPPRAKIAALEPIAREMVGAHGTAPVVLEVDVLPTADLIHTVDVGDVVTVVVDDGWVQVDDQFRVVAWTLDCETDVLTLALNEE